MSFDMCDIKNIDSLFYYSNIILVILLTFTWYRLISIMIISNVPLLLEDIVLAVSRAYSTITRVMR